MNDFDELHNLLRSIISRMDTIETKIDNQVVKESTLTIGQFVQKWYETYKKPHLAASTAYKTLGLISKYVLPIFGDIPLATKDSMLFQKLLLEIPCERQREHLKALLADMYNKAYITQLVSFNPMLAVELPHHDTKGSDAFSPSEEKKFVNYCKKDKTLGLMFIVMLYTGIRLGEARALKKSDFVNDNGKIIISKSLWRNNEGNTKTKSGNRTIPIQDSLKSYLQDFDFGKFNKDEYIFNCCTAVATRHFNEIISNCKFKCTKKFTTHSLRKTFITRCYEVGMNPKVVTKMAGHTDVGFTMKRYQQIQPHFEKSEFDKLNKKGVKNRQKL